MATIKFFKLSKNELENTIQEFEEEGWEFNKKFLKDSKLETRITDPFCETWTVERSIQTLNGKLVFGNEQQIYAYKALNLYNALYNKFGPAYLGFNPKENNMFEEEKDQIIFQKHK
jgi:hypothetical protein